MDNNNNVEEQQPKSERMADHFANLRQQWVEVIVSLNEKLKNVNTLRNLLSEVYVKRQEAVETYHTIYSLYSKHNLQYRKKHAELYNNLKIGQNGIRYTSETSINAQCEARLYEEKRIIDELKNFSDYMYDTIKTIDGLQFAVSNVMKLIEIENGIKF